MSEYNKSIKGKLHNYFNQRLNLKNSTNGFIRGNCPYCGGKFTFGVNVEALKVKCFKECGVPNNAIALLMFLEGFETRYEAYAFLKIQQEYEAYDGAIKIKALQKSPVILPESYTLVGMGEGIIAKAAKHYIKTRRFKVTQCAMQGIGYCAEGLYAGYIIFPFYYRGQLEFFQGRRFAGGGPKMQNPKQEDFGIGKSQLIYNRDALFIYNRIYICESITNALTMGERAIATLGKKLSPYQLSTLIKAPFEEAIILLDMDAWEEAINLALQLVHYKRVKLVYWPVTEKNEDVNDLGKKKTLEYCKQIPFMKYHELYMLKNNPPTIICVNAQST